MSRAFVKEPDGDQVEDNLPDLPQSTEPNYITPAGFKELEQRFRELKQRRNRLEEDKDELSVKTEIRQVERDLRRLKNRIEHAVIVDPAQQSNNLIRFGATVIVLDENGERLDFTLVGEDEHCAATRRISWKSPLGKALLGKQAGDMVWWERPVGNVELEIESFHYGDRNKR